MIFSNAAVENKILILQHLKKHLSDKFQQNSATLTQNTPPKDIFEGPNTSLTPQNITFISTRKHLKNPIAGKN